MKMPGIEPRTYAHHKGGIAIRPKGNRQIITFSRLAFMLPHLEATIFMAAEYSKQQLGVTTQHWELACLASPIFGVLEAKASPMSIRATITEHHKGEAIWQF